jgi:predicted small lipoprotein YifL
MHRHHVVSCVGIVLVTLAGCGGTPPEETPEAAVPPAPEQRTELRIEGVGFTTPESVLYDPAADVYLVANINGSPSDEDDNGFISRLSPDGTLIELLWIDGQDEGVTLDAPKGMAIIGDTLYVADISRVRSFDRETGASLGEIEIPGSTFVNDLAAGRDGWLLVSDSGVRFTAEGVEDTGSAAVYVISPEGELQTVAAGEELERPNGVIDSIARDGIVVVPFGGNMVYRLDEDGSRADLAELPAGGLDGVVETPDGRLLVSSWGGSAIYAVEADGAVETVAGDLPAPADIGYDPGRGVILVPLFNDNAVVFVPDPVAR